MNEDRLLRVLAFVNNLEQQEAAGREAQKLQVAEQAKEIDQSVQSIDQQQQSAQEMQQDQMQQDIMQNFNQGG
jgi:hypothetical protein